MPAPYQVGCHVVLLLVFSFSRMVLSDDVHASIKNRLGNGENLSIHCQSKDDDLGQQDIADGSEFGWDFSVNAWGTTLLYCDMEWENARRSHFDAYSFSRDHTRCETQCSWLISKEDIIPTDYVEINLQINESVSPNTWTSQMLDQTELRYHRNNHLNSKAFTAM
ncbi:PREDICTED: uncharacterized protein LOC105112886 [Populus euphratica]|uniref:S-protein homolog n=1 Tax=Populus euphratica TaxID=75702 RepID=A0AAJ6T973_POPEU|nr:PREDICTED: uncharacterized protein LOC105112886 [Populus euphratica]